MEIACVKFLFDLKNAVSRLNSAFGGILWVICAVKAHFVGQKLIGIFIEVFLYSNRRLFKLLRVVYNLIPCLLDLA